MTKDPQAPEGRAKQGGPSFARAGTIGVVVALPRLGENERRLMWLMFARLVLSSLSLAIAMGLDGIGQDLAPAERRGLYWTVACAFLATAVTGVGFHRMRRTQFFAAVQIAIDVAIVTALVHFSGGRESVFTFLYVLVTLYGAALCGRGGALGAATLSALAYAGILAGENTGWLLVEGRRPSPTPWPMLAAVWAVHVGALYLVGTLASVLSGELARTGATLDQRTSDLWRLRDLHRRTVESLMSGLMTLGLDGRVTSFNPEAERITGMSAHAAIGLPVDEVIPGAVRLVHEHDQGAGATPRARLRYESLRGEDLFLGLASSVLTAVDGTPAGHVVIFQDVTEVVAMEAELRSSERLAAVGEMAAKMAHEIRNPLASISGSIQVLRSESAEDGEGCEPTRLMDIVVRETDRLNGLITDFLTFARPAPLKQDDVVLAGLLAELETLLEAAGDERIMIAVEASPRLTAWADADQLRQVLWNLCRNAIQAMPEGGQLTIRVDPAPDSQGDAALGRNHQMVGTSGEARPADWVMLEVRDTGPGIPPDVQERMFEPFFTTKRDGSGLGLSTVHRIVESHGGELEIESRVGQGTRVRIRLPASSDAFGSGGLG